MLTPQEVRRQLESIADEVAQPAGVYYELFSRMYSQRVRRWIRTVPHSEAMVIQREVENDPDYLADIELPDIDSTESALAKSEPANIPLSDIEKTSPPPRQTMLFNPAWDMDY
jgi:hypothetical protein